MSGFRTKIDELKALFAQGEGKTLATLSLILIVNALSYGTIMPLLYPYAQRYGLTAIGLGALFISFSLFQFLATPIMGRLSDQYGRKPLLVLSLLGTAGSLALFALAQSVPLLFLARILDGITGGNVSVAQAVIADTTEGEQRDKAFGLLGASFGFGFLLGPALGGLLSGVAPALPFWVAAATAVTAATMTTFFLEETLSPADRKHSLTDGKPLFDFKSMLEALTWPVVGRIIIISFLAFTAHHALILGFNIYAVDVFELSQAQLGWFFTAIGLISLLMQGLGIGFLLKIFAEKRRVLLFATIGTLVLTFTMFVIQEVTIFIIATLLYAALFAPQGVMLTGIISERTKSEDQGGILGIQQSYRSLGQIFGPAIAGAVAFFSSNGVFLAATLVFALSLGVIFKLGHEPQTVQADL